LDFLTQININNNNKTDEELINGNINNIEEEDKINILVV
jgi:hypothetical protein